MPTLRELYPEAYPEGKPNHKVKKPDIVVTDAAGTTLTVRTVAAARRRTGDTVLAITKALASGKPARSGISYAYVERVFSVRYNLTIRVEPDILNLFYRKYLDLGESKTEVRERLSRLIEKAIKAELKLLG